MMTAKRFVYTNADGILSVMQPAYFDHARPLRFSGASLKKTPEQGWVFSHEGQEHTELSGNILVTDADITFPDGQTIFAETQEEYEARAIANCQRAGHFGTAYFVTTRDRIPPDSNFCAAWEWTGDSVQVNMSKARVIHMDRIRKMRDTELTALDGPYMKALEVGDTVEQQRIAGLKQKLRDIPQKYDLSVFKTPEKLKAFWPKELEELDERIKDAKKAL